MVPLVQIKRIQINQTIVNAKIVHTLSDAYWPPFSFYLSLNVVVVSCVIKEPTFNHEREGRGNFVQEGKSGDLHHRLASLTQTQSC